MTICHVVYKKSAFLFTCPLFQVSYKVVFKEFLCFLRLFIHPCNENNGLWSSFALNSLSEQEKKKTCLWFNYKCFVVRFYSNVDDKKSKKVTKQSFHDDDHFFVLHWTWQPVVTTVASKMEQYWPTTSSFPQFCRINSTLTLVITGYTSPPTNYCATFWLVCNHKHNCEGSPPEL